MARQMKDSGVEWIGQIPEDWEIVRIKQLFAEVDERCTKGNEYTLLSVSEYYGVSPKKDHLNEDDMLTRAETLDGYKICRKNDIVMNIMLAWKRALGVSEYVGIISPAYCVYRARQEVCAKYFHYLFRTDIYAELFKQNSTGIIDSRLRLYPDKFLALKCQVPPLEQQEKIVSYLDRKCAEIDAIIAKQQKIIEKLKEYKLSVITEAVTKGLDPNVPMKDSGVEWIGMVPERWKVGQLKYFATIRAGLTLGKKYEIDAKLVEMPYLRVANVQGEYVDLSDVSSVSVLPEEVEKYSLHKNELLMTEGGDKDKLGRGCVWNGEIDPCLHQNHVFAVATDAKKLSIHFLSYLTTSGVARSYFEYTAKKTTNLASTNSTIILQFKLPIPSIQEQGDIICYLDKCCKQINTLIHEKENILSKINEYKKALIYEVVTGKKEVL